MCGMKCNIKVIIIYSNFDSMNYDCTSTTNRERHLGRILTLCVRGFKIAQLGKTTV